MSNTTTANVEKPRNSIMRVREALATSIKNSPPKKRMTHIWHLYQALEFLNEAIFDMVEGKNGWPMTNGKAFQWSLLHQREAIAHLSSEDRLEVLSGVDALRKHLIKLEKQDRKLIKQLPATETQKVDKS